MTSLYFHQNIKYIILEFTVFHIRKLLLIIFKLTDSFLFHVQSTHKPITGILHFCYREFDFQHFLLIFLRVFISLFVLSPWFYILPTFSIRIINSKHNYLKLFINYICVISEFCSDACFVSSDCDFSCLVVIIIIFNWKLDMIHWVTGTEENILVWGHMLIWLEIELYLMF